MAHAQVTIGGRPYKLACNPGEEEHMAALGRYVDSRITEMAGAFRDIADQRIVVMAALGIADEVFAARTRAEKQAAEAAEALARETAAREAAEDRVAMLEVAVAETVARVEALTESLAPNGE